LYAKENIKRGEQIIIEKPLFIINANELEEKFPRDQINVDMINYFEDSIDVDKSLKEKILNLHDQFESKFGFKSI